jgi:hypothetical protein
MTRDRKKCFVSTMEQAIADLEKEMARIRSILALDSDHRPANDKTLSSPQIESLPSTQEATTATAGAASLKVNVAAVTPEFSALPSPKDRSSSSPPTTSAEEKLSPKFAFPAYQQRTKRACHGFSLDD